MNEREIFKKFDLLSKDELNTKNDKNIYVRNDIMTAMIKRSRVAKNRGQRNTDAFRKKN